ncbi:NRDE family protein [Neobacillus sp. FSL H8-0543]|uniref:NRDE family protein n=1 Tax=Neobacillus sp. FSL H8-0543 TaxID=2954672 RepID=UPI0031593D6F
MCLVLIAYKVHPEYPLIVAANRDEFFQRPTAPAHYWEDHPDIFAGRDLEKMGTWMGVTNSGRFAALTNYRDPKEETEGKRSRGELVADALQYKGQLKEYMVGLMNNNELYPGYNLLAGNHKELFYYSNIGRELLKVEPGIYGVSNHLLNTEWPKVRIGKEGLSQIINHRPENMAEGLLNLLKNADPAPDELLPNTGVSLEWERMLSPLHIKSEEYGTRSSTVMLMADKEIQYTERVFSKGAVNEHHQIIHL